MAQISSTAVRQLPKVYPHVKEIEDFPVSQTTRLLWDRIFDLESRLQAAEATNAALIAGHNDHDTAITEAQKAIQGASADAAAASGTTVTGGVDALTVASMVADAGPFAIGPTATTFPTLGSVQIYSSPDISTWTQTSTFSM